MIHPNTELKFISDTIGYGVFATQFIPKGTIVYVKDKLELEIAEDRYLSLDEPLKSTIEKYSYIDEKGNRIVSWDHGKYVNHCCDCNTMSTGYGFEIAIRDIQPGEEITDEYGLFNLEYEMPLSCSKPECRGMVCKSDLLENYAKWDDKVKAALEFLNNVKQPLLPLVEPDVKKAVMKYVKTGKNYISVINLLKKEVHTHEFAMNGME